MSILSALKQQHSSIDDLAKLPQAMIMQMAQKKQISQDMLAPILARKAEMMDAVSRSKSLQPQPPVPTVMEQVMQKNIQAENPQPQMPQEPQDAGVAQLPIPERQYAGGGIVAFKQGDLVDLDEDIDEEDLMAEYADAMKAGELAMMMSPQENAGVGIKYKEPMPKGGSKGINFEGGKHPYESLVTAKAKEFGVDPRLASYILNKETGGLKNPENARSSAGAMGIAQFMPATAKQYGINPDIPEEAAIGMGKHLRHLMDKYDDPKLAAIAYNWGEGNTNKWLKAGADMDKLPKETRKYVAQLAHGGEVQHFDLGGKIDTVGAELDALRSGAKTLEEKLMSIGSRGTGRDEIQLAYENAAKLRKEKELEYEALMSEAGVDKPSFFPQSSLSTKRPEPNPIVQRESAGVKPKPVPVPSAPAAAPSAAPAVPAVSTAPSAQDLQAFDQATALFEAERRANAPKTKEEAVQSYWDKVMGQMEASRADIAKQRADDKNMALLAAGLGMLGGTSPYAFANIGQGGMSGVSYLSEANKQRAAEKAALDKNMLIAQRYKELGETAKGNQAGLLALRGAELDEKKKVHLYNELNNKEKMAAAQAKEFLKVNPIAGFNAEDPTDIERMKYKILAQDPTFLDLHNRYYGYGFNASPISLGGGTLAQDAAAEKARRDSEKNKEKK